MARGAGRGPPIHPRRWTWRWGSDQPWRRRRACSSVQTPTATSVTARFDAKEQQLRRIGDQRQVEDVEQQRERQDGCQRQGGAMRGGEGQPETGGVGEQRMAEGARVEAFETGGTFGRVGSQPRGDDAIYRLL